MKYQSLSGRQRAHSMDVLRTLEVVKQTQIDATLPTFLWQMICWESLPQSTWAYVHKDFFRKTKSYDFATMMIKGLEHEVSAVKVSAVKNTRIIENYVALKH
jgi:hypothetical protein